MKNIILKPITDHIFPKDINPNMEAIIVAYSGGNPAGYIIHIGERWIFTSDIDLTNYEDLDYSDDLRDLLEYLEKTYSYTFKLMEFYS